MSNDDTSKFSAALVGHIDDRQVVDDLIRRASDQVDGITLEVAPSEPVALATKKDGGHVKAEVIARSVTDPKLAARFSRDQRKGVRRAVAGNPHLVGDDLAKLHRWAVDNTDAETLRETTRRVDPNVLLEASTADSAKVMLTALPSEAVAANAARSVSTFRQVYDLPLSSQQRCHLIAAAYDQEVTVTADEQPVDFVELVNDLDDEMRDAALRHLLHRSSPLNLRLAELLVEFDDDHLEQMLRERRYGSTARAYRNSRGLANDRSTFISVLTIRAVPTREAFHHLVEHGPKELKAWALSTRHCPGDLRWQTIESAVADADGYLLEAAFEPTSTPPRGDVPEGARLGADQITWVAARLQSVSSPFSNSNGWPVLPTVSECLRHVEQQLAPRARLALLRCGNANLTRDFLSGGLDQHPVAGELNELVDDPGWAFDGDTGQQTRVLLHAVRTVSEASSPRYYGETWGDDAEWFDELFRLVPVASLVSFAGPNNRIGREFAERMHHVFGGDLSLWSAALTMAVSSESTFDQLITAVFTMLNREPPTIGPLPTLATCADDADDTDTSDVASEQLCMFTA